MAPICWLPNAVCIEIGCSQITNWMFNYGEFSSMRLWDNPKKHNSSNFLTAHRLAGDDINSLNNSHHLTTQRPVFSCVWCGVQDNLVLHKATHQVSNPQCPMCNKKFNRIASLKSHILIHEHEESLFCTECGDEFPNQASRLFTYKVIF